MDSTSYCSWTLQFQTCGGPSLAKPFSLSQSRIRLRCPISRTVSRFATCQILLAVVFLLHAADGAMLPGIFKAGSADVCSQQGIHVVHWHKPANELVVRCWNSQGIDFFNLLSWFSRPDTVTWEQIFALLWWRKLKLHLKPNQKTWHLWSNRTNFAPGTGRKSGQCHARTWSRNGDAHWELTSSLAFMPRCQSTTQQDAAHGTNCLFFELLNLGRLCLTQVTLGSIVFVKDLAKQWNRWFRFCADFQSGSTCSRGRVAPVVNDDPDGPSPTPRLYSYTITLWLCRTHTHTVDGRIIQTLIHRATPLTPNINVIFLFGSFLRMDEINQPPRAGTALRNHNIEIRGR